MTPGAVATPPRRALLRGRSRSRPTPGDAAAFAVLYERHQQELYRYCRSIVRHDEDARDAVQSAMAKAFAALQNERRDLQLRPWLFRIAHNEAISLLRRRPDTTELDEHVGGGADTLHEAVELRERLAHLRQDLQDLPERQRAALVMRELSGMGHEEIALALDTSARAVKQTIYEARCGLSDCAEGRDMECDAVRRILSDDDRRVTRNRRIRAHLRSCRGCRAFRTALVQRPKELAALSPVVPLAATGLLGLGGAAAGGGGVTAGSGAVAGAAAASGGLAGGGAAGAGGFALAGAAKIAAVVAATATVGGGVAAVSTSGPPDAVPPSVAARAPAAAAGTAPVLRARAAFVVPAPAAPGPVARALRDQAGTPAGRAERRSPDGGRADARPERRGARSERRGARNDGGAATPDARARRRGPAGRGAGAGRPAGAEGSVGRTRPVPPRGGTGRPVRPARPGVPVPSSSKREGLAQTSPPVTRPAPKTTPRSAPSPRPTPRPVARSPRGGGSAGKAPVVRGLAGVLTRGAAKPTAPASGPAG